jgi:nucleotide-binding universal stress UspA family protein
MFKKILVAVDGSSTANRGLKTAINLAKEQKTVLLVLHVVDERSPVMYPEGGMYLDQVINMLRDAGRKIIAGAQRDASKQGIQVQTKMVETMGLPVAEVIVREAKRSRADLIVLGTHGRRGISRLVMGSDAEGVVRQCSVPVLLVRAPEPKARKRSSRR